MMDSADPLSGWLHADYMPHAPIAKADVYGSLFFFLRDLFLKFCKRIQNTNILFHLYNMDARDLPEYLLQDGKAFDRIEVCYNCPYSSKAGSAPMDLCELFLTVSCLKKCGIS